MSTPTSTEGPTVDTGTAPAPTLVEDALATPTEPAPRGDAPVPATLPADGAAVPGVPAVDAVADDDEDVDPEKEGDVAADYLEELLDIADLDGDIDLDVEGERAVVSLVGGDLDVLVGSGGVVLEALQDLTRLAVLRATGRRSRLLLDVAGWREQRREQIRRQATEAVATVQASGGPLSLPPMTAYERKIVHDVVAEQGLVSESDGQDATRHVVIRAS